MPADELHARAVQLRERRRGPPRGEQQVFDEVVASGFPITMAQARLCERIADEGSRLTQLARGHRGILRRLREITDPYR